MHGVWPSSGCIFSTRDLHRNLHIWWRVRTCFYDAIYLCFLTYTQAAPYLVLRDQISISSKVSWIVIFQNFNVVLDSSQWDISKETINSQGFCENVLDLIMYLTPQPWGQVTYMPKKFVWSLNNPYRDRIVIYSTMYDIKGMCFNTFVHQLSTGGGVYMYVYVLELLNWCWL